MSITTQKGDAGTSRSGAGEELLKTDLLFEASGDLDELQCALGLARAHIGDHRLLDSIIKLQEKLLQVGGMISGVRSMKKAISGKDVDELTELCARLEEKPRRSKGFVLPGETVSAAHLESARAIARRCERRIVALSEAGRLSNTYVLAWMNRLSDYLWLLARFDEEMGRQTKRIYPLNIRR